MKVIFVVDNISEINQKINMIKNHFGNDIIFVVNAKIKKIYNTYGFPTNAVYGNNLTHVIHTILSKNEVQDVVVCYSSIKLTNDLLNKFISKIGNKQNIVNVMPNYSIMEKISLSCYNLYVKSLFKMKDNTASPKLQFLPSGFVEQLIESSFGNRMFETVPEHTTKMFVEDKDISNSLKVKMSFNRFCLIPIIVALVISMALIITLALTKVNYVLILVFSFLYILDIVLFFIFRYKQYFDKRFLK